MTQSLSIYGRHALKANPPTANGNATGIASRFSGTGNGHPSAALSRLASLPYSEFASSVAQALEMLGYQDVGFTLPSKHLGKNRGGGIDLVATPPDGRNRKDKDRPRRTVVVQLRQFRPGETVQQRAVDEVRGACLRANAEEALLVTTGRFSPLARQNALRSQRSGIAPVYLLDGEALASACESAYGSACLDAALQIKSKTGSAGSVGGNGVTSMTASAVRAERRRLRARPAAASALPVCGGAGQRTGVCPNLAAEAGDPTVIVSVRISVRQGPGSEQTQKIARRDPA